MKNKKKHPIYHYQPKDFVRFQNCFEDYGIIFPENFGLWIKSLYQKKEVRSNLISESLKSKIEDSDTFTQFFAKYTNTKKTQFTPYNLIPLIVRTSEYWENVNALLTQEELSTIHLCSLIAIKTCVLYKKDIAPHSAMSHEGTVIAFDTNPDLYEIPFLH